MRFKVAQWGNSTGHKKMVTCVAWNSSEEIYSTGEDHLLISWHLEGGTAHATTVTQFPNDFYPTDMQWHPRSVQTHGTSIKKQSLDVLLITTADGKFHFVNKNGRIEKSVEAHKGAALAGKWSFDGSALLTSGEDGTIKIWSRSGMLRSTIVRATLPVLATSWSPDCTMILFSQGSQLAIQSLNSNSKPQKWYAHEGLILVVSWCKSNGLILSGGEDCRYKLWDNNGNQLYSSSGAEFPITAVNWSFNGNYFAVGSYNTIKLCDKTGWSHSLEKVNTGSIYSIAWSNDSTQVAMACGNGSVLTAHVIDRRLEWNNYEATLVRRKTIEVREVGNEILETLEIADRVVHFEFAFGHLVVVTPSQCHVYSTTNWNTPAIFELKNASISAVLLADKHFLLIEWNSVTLYSYQGRLLSVPKWKGMSQEPLYPPCIALCSDTLVVRDQSNGKMLHILEISANKPAVEAQHHLHQTEVIAIAINYIGSITDRQLAVIDVNRDLYLVTVRTSGFGRVCKIASMAQSIAWATDANVLAAMLDATLSVWLCPNCVHYSDRKVIRKTRIDRENSEFGKQPSIVNVSNGMVTVRRGDGALVATAFYTFFISLHKLITSDKWQEALSICRIAQNEIVWTCMAVMATDAKQMSAAEEAYAAIERYDKVDYIQRINITMSIIPEHSQKPLDVEGIIERLLLQKKIPTKLPNKTEKLAEMLLLAGDLLGAEGILLQNGLINEAIRMNIEMYSWNRALEVATRHKKLVKEVLESRSAYLKELDKEEMNSSFLALMGNQKKPQPQETKTEKKDMEMDELIDETTVF